MASSKIEEWSQKPTKEQVNKEKLLQKGEKEKKKKVNQKQVHINLLYDCLDTS